MANWMDDENARANNLVKTGDTANKSAPRLKKPIKRVTPIRSIKSIYIQELHARAFDKLVFNQKMVKGKKAPELMEEAIELIMAKYKTEF